MCVWMRACVRACVRSCASVLGGGGACVHACDAYVYACVQVYTIFLPPSPLLFVRSCALDPGEGDAVSVKRG